MVKEPPKDSDRCAPHETHGFSANFSCSHGTSSGPFQVINSNQPVSDVITLEPPRRRYTCLNYDTCLDLAAALNWDSFTCRGCNGCIDERLYWRAKQAIRRDGVAKEICDLPSIPVFVGTTNTPDSVNNTAVNNTAPIESGAIANGPLVLSGSGLKVSTDS